MSDYVSLERRTPLYSWRPSGMCWYLPGCERSIQ